MPRLSQNMRFALGMLKTSWLWTFVVLGTTSIIGFSRVIPQKIDLVLGDQKSHLQIMTGLFVFILSFSINHRYTYGNKMRHLSKTKKNTEAKSFNLTFRYIDGVLSINNPNFAN